MLGIITVALPRSITSDGSLITPSDCSLLFGNKPNTITIVAPEHTKYAGRKSANASRGS